MDHLNEIMLRGNICACGEVWFTLDIPESDPDRCPFCGMHLNLDEELDIKNGEIIKPKEDLITVDDLPELEGAIDKVNNFNLNDNNTMSLKICTFCMNEVLFDSKDAHKASYCPFCDNNLVIPSEIDFIDNINQQNILPEPNINELMNSNVIITLENGESISGIFHGMDIVTMLIKITPNNQNTRWIKMDHVHSISPIS